MSTRRTGAMWVAGLVALAGAVVGPVPAGAAGPRGAPPGATTPAIASPGTPAGVLTAPTDGAGTSGGARGREVTVDRLPGLSEDGARAIGINNRGRVTGESTTAEGARHAVLWDGDEVVDLTPDVPVGVFGPTATGIDVGDGGRVLMFHGVIDSLGRHDFNTWTWADGVLTDLTPELSFTMPVDVDRWGRVLFNGPAPVGPGGAAVWQDGTITRSPGVHGGPFMAEDMNEWGLVVGTAPDGSGTGNQVAHRWRPGQAPDALGTLGGAGSEAVGVNGRGQVAGTSTTPEGASRAFVWHDGEMTDLGTLGGAESRVQVSPNSPTPHRVINPWGDVVGSSETAAGETHAFLWCHGEMVDLGTLGGDDSAALAVNAWRQVIGMSTTAGGASHAFLWQNGRMLDLTDLVGDTFVPTDINDRGQVVGYTQAGTTPQAYRVNVPVLWGHLPAGDAQAR